jgi:hypothetical protein
MANGFHDGMFDCAAMVPQAAGYGNLRSTSQICSVIGAEPRSPLMNDDQYGVVVRTAGTLVSYGYTSCSTLQLVELC